MSVNINIYIERLEITNRIRRWPQAVEGIIAILIRRKLPAQIMVGLIGILLLIQP
jgi:hypothetical protein